MAMACETLEYVVVQKNTFLEVLVKEAAVPRVLEEKQTLEQFERA